MSETVTIWVTKYALTDCVRRYEARPSSVSAGMMLVDRSDGSTMYLHGEGRDWHRSEAAALAHAEQMRRKKIASLEAQILRLEQLKFAVKAGDQS